MRVARAWKATCDRRLGLELDEDGLRALSSYLALTCCPGWPCRAGLVGSSVRVQSSASLGG